MLSQLRQQPRVHKHIIIFLSLSLSKQKRVGSELLLVSKCVVLTVITQETLLLFSAETRPAPLGHPAVWKQTWRQWTCQHTYARKQDFTHTLHASFFVTYPSLSDVYIGEISRDTSFWSEASSVSVPPRPGQTHTYKFTFEDISLAYIHSVEARFNV